MFTRRLLCTGLVWLAIVAAPSGWSAPPDWAGRPGGPGAAKYHGLVVFGDSLSDTGNDLILTATLRFDPSVPPSSSPHRTYHQGRFSNGPVAAEYLWQLMSGEPAAIEPSLAFPKLGTKSAASFAFGGSGSGGTTTNPGGFTVPGLLTQVETFGARLQGKKAHQHALFALWTGANDYIFYGATDVRPVIANVVTAIETLHSFGARNFLVPNLPDLGLTPLGQSLGLGPVLSSLTRAHNAGLAEALDGVAARLPDTRILRVDVYTLMHDLLRAGSIAAMPPATELLAPGSGASDCLLRDPATCPDVDLSAQLPPLMFWDALHPSTHAHELVGRAMFDSVRR
ncbi:MAG TPA: SGNH/GDSL hydrolase family protein [Burkholderiaceae bacterium]|nr:SGNH/GDSL hydrolase family protein [Burkholderiaceae bacterium]